ncbi:molybdopterin cofactor-binding domain-containing protein [Streptomyces inhibens]|uniref:molybdopterin cofactor-binding domain-containing protein n=1 Tax=Streptomyces inhibens TaxID=2293571 RepID=UPI00402A61D8
MAKLLGRGHVRAARAQDLVALATLDSGRPVCFEYTREEEFTTASPRHPMTLTVKLGAKADGTLTAFQVRNVASTGAYGNHGGETLYAGGAAVMIYRCPKQEVRRVFRPMSRPPAPGGSSGPASRVHCTRPRRRPSTSPRPGARSATTSCTSWPLANALHDATGVRFRALPLTPERVYGRLDENRSVPTV